MVCRRGPTFAARTGDGRVRVGADAVPDAVFRNHQLCAGALLLRLRLLQRAAGRALCDGAWIDRHDSGDSIEHDDLRERAGGGSAQDERFDHDDDVVAEQHARRRGDGGGDLQLPAADEPRLVDHDSAHPHGVDGDHAVAGSGSVKRAARIILFIVVFVLHWQIQFLALSKADAVQSTNVARLLWRAKNSV